ncbi:DUF1534 domain-containing protein [Pseudomonas syringae pv. tomato]|nr:DUF1534 domain-containing protein [Pseudomonas syringae pv. tomato]PYD04020.1 hypothetical protein DND90_05855 [Pseudomonas syringae pv. maculicola]
MRDAPRHRSAQHRVFKVGRGSEQEWRLFTCRRRYESLRQ